MSAVVTVLYFIPQPDHPVSEMSRMFNILTEDQVRAQERKQLP